MLDQSFTIGGILGLLVLFLIVGAVFMFGKPAVEGSARYVAGYFCDEEQLAHIDKTLLDK